MLKYYESTWHNFYSSWIRMASKQIFDSMLTLGTTVFQIYSCTHFPYSFLVEKKTNQNGHLKNSNQSCHSCTTSLGLGFCRWESGVDMEAGDQFSVNSRKINRTGKDQEWKPRRRALTSCGPSYQVNCSITSLPSLPLPKDRQPSLHIQIY